MPRWPNGKEPKSHCKHGHPFDDQNTYTDKHGTRYCRACRKVKYRKYLTIDDSRDKIKAANKRTYERLRSERANFPDDLYQRTLDAQGGACAICRRPFSDPKDAMRDHCHDHLLPRGILCNSCNAAEGHIKRTGLSPVEFGKRLADYLKNPPAQSLVEAS